MSVKQWKRIVAATIVIAMAFIDHKLGVGILAGIYVIETLDFENAHPEESLITNVLIAIGILLFCSLGWWALAANGLFHIYATSTTDDEDESPSMDEKK